MSQKNPEHWTGRELPHALAFAALGDEMRLLLVRRLATGKPVSISELAEGAQITRQAITKHLRVLERAEIVRSERTGRETHFLLNRRPLHELQRYLERIGGQWDETLDRLKTFVEE